MRNATTASRTTTIAAATLVLLAALVPGTTRAGSLGAPLKGVDVKLGKPPGGGAAARTTDDLGNFNFGVVPKGTYVLTVALRENPRTAPPAVAARHGLGPQSPAPQTCVIEINGAAGGTMEVGWDLKNGKRIGPATGSAAILGTAGEIVLTSDGQHPLNGTVVRPKSNISNN